MYQSAVFEYVERCTDIDSAIQKLDYLLKYLMKSLWDAYKKARESLDKFFKVLEKSKRNSNFWDHSAEECSNEAMQDVFFTGIASHVIWQYLLEKINLDLQTAYSQTLYRIRLWFNTMISMLLQTLKWLQ